MNAADVNDRSGWSPARWIVVVGCLAAVQIGAFLAWSHWPTLGSLRAGLAAEVILDFPARAPTTPAGGNLVWETDPRQFAKPDPAGFSGLATRAMALPEYELARWTAAPRWLPGSTQFTRLGAIPAPPLVPSGAHPMPSPHQGSVALTPLVLPAQSQTLVRGDLAGREFRAFTPLPQAAGSDVLSPTVIDLAVSPGGVVILTRLAASSGQRDLDLLAAEWARGLRFAATDYETSPAASDPATWTDGQLVIQWRVEASLR